MAVIDVEYIGGPLDGEQRTITTPMHRVVEGDEIRVRESMQIGAQTRQVVYEARLAALSQRGRVNLTFAGYEP